MRAAFLSNQGGQELRVFPVKTPAAAHVRRWMARVPKKDGEVRQCHTDFSRLVNTDLNANLKCLSIYNLISVKITPL